MTVKLTDAQVVIMRVAAQREDLCLTAPQKMKGAREKDADSEFA